MRRRCLHETGRSRLTEARIPYHNRNDCRGTGSRIHYVTYLVRYRRRAGETCRGGKGERAVTIEIACSVSCT